MSFDPFGQPSPSPPPAGVATGPPGPAGYTPEMAQALVRERIVWPAMFLIAVGILNLLMGGYILLNGIVAGSMSEQEFRKVALGRYSPRQREQLEEAGYTPEVMHRMTVRIAYGIAGFALFGCLLTLVGGVRMIQLRSYGVCVLAALATAIPGLSCSAFCCLGEIIGLWALFILAQPDVRAAFR